MKLRNAVLNVHGPGESEHNRNYHELRKYFSEDSIYSPHIDYESESPNDIFCRIMMNGPYDLIVGESLGGVFAAGAACLAEKEVVITNIWLRPCDYAADLIENYRYAEELKEFGRFFEHHNVYGSAITSLEDDWNKRGETVKYVPWALGCMDFFEPYEGGDHSDRSFEDIFRDCTIGSTMYAGTGLNCPDIVFEEFDNYINGENSKGVLYICGKQGAGKTAAVKEYLKAFSRKFPDKKPEYISAEDLCEEIEASGRTCSFKALKGKYAAAAFVVIDNFELMINEKRNTVLLGIDAITTAVMDAGGKIIILSRRMPQTLLEGRSRLMEKIADGKFRKMRRNKHGKTEMIYCPKSWEPAELRYRELHAKEVSWPGPSLLFQWSGSMGWGELSLYKKDDGKWHADTERMASESDKSFIAAVLKSFAEDIIVDD